LPEITIPESSINSSTAAPITIDEVELSVINIPTVGVKNFSGAFTYASSTAKDVEISMEVSVSSSFNGLVFVPWPICCVSVCGTLDIASYTQKNNLGDVSTLAGSFTMKAPSVDFGPFSLKPDPIGETTVAKMKVKMICMHCTDVTMPNPLGITFGDSFPVQNPTGPMNTRTQTTTMKELDSTKISTPAATGRNIKMSNIVIPTMTTGPMTITAITPMSVTMSMPLYGSGVTTTGNADCQQIVTTVTLNVSSVTMDIKGGIEFTGLAGSVTAASADSAPFEMDLRLVGLKIKGLSLFGLTMPEMEVHV
jgi:hypothetical protein